ncbi:MAG: hypothetical protein EP336_13815 [Rhodobacteraceae bacterium]|nr:MAG: hypothetical protein EP336_13815 [Paracoccaceae bacterium]
MKVFYSWQMDAPRKVNKDFILEALKMALSDLEGEIEPAEREGKPFKLDHDTKDVLGSPPIREIIFEKISKADVIVCDVSLVAQGKEDKKHINSNVGIELGYAIGARGYEVVLSVMNAAHGDFNGLPFDLRDRRAPVSYKLLEGASKDEIATCKRQLVSELKAILREYALKRRQSADARPLFVAQESSFVPTAFWEFDKPLVENMRTGTPYYCQTKRLISVRILPHTSQTPLSILECQERVRNLPPFYVGSYDFNANRWGAVSFTYEHNSHYVIGAAQIFKSREIWSFSTDIIWQSRRGDADLADWFVSHEEIMKYLPDAIENAISTAQEIIAGDFDLLLTAADLDKVFVKTGLVGRAEKKQIFENSVEFRTQVGTVYDSQKIAFEFAKKIYAAAGVDLPNRIPSGRHV